MKLGWVEISFTWHGPGSAALKQKRLDQKLREIYAAPGYDGGFIACIKHHRKVTGSDLKTAKEYCDKMFGRGPYRTQA